MPVRALACARGGWTYGPWVPKIQPMSNGAVLTLGPLRLLARWSLRTADHVGRFSFLIADMFRGLAEWRTWVPIPRGRGTCRSEEHTSELQSQSNLVCRLLLEK